MSGSWPPTGSRRFSPPNVARRPRVGVFSTRDEPAEAARPEGSMTRTGRCCWRAPEALGPWWAFLISSLMTLPRYPAPSPISAGGSTSCSPPALFPAGGHDHVRDAQSGLRLEARFHVDEQARPGCVAGANARIQAGAAASGPAQTLAPGAGWCAQGGARQRRAPWPRSRAHGRDIPVRNRDPAQLDRLQRPHARRLIRPGLRAGRRCAQE